MIFRIPPNKFKNCLFMEGFYMVFFEDPDNTDYLPILKHMRICLDI